VDRLIHHDRSPYKHTRFPFVPFFADRKTNGEPFGLAKDSARASVEAAPARPRA